MRIPDPCNRCSSIPLNFRCSDSYCIDCPVFVEFFFPSAYEQMSFDDLFSPYYVPVKPMSFWEYELASVAKEREELINE